MIRPIQTSTFMLGLPSRPATADDLTVGQDLIDTLEAHAHECVGMAGNMIGAAVRIIVFDDKGTRRLMFNPEIIASSGEYETKEGCLSLDGVRETKRFRDITVRYQDQSFTQHEESFSNWTAQIIQHEIDHCNGIVI